jgi:hypothetical protein
MSVSAWLQFLRHYGPIPRNDNMYDETIQRSARRQKIQPIEFEHPMQDLVLGSFDRRTADPVSVILTGTAGDGKTHLCRKVWTTLGGDPLAWESNNPYLSLQASYPLNRQSWPETEDDTLFRTITVHFIRDLSGWAPQQGREWDSDKQALLLNLCKCLFDADSGDVFLIAANDGQLMETWRRLEQSPEVRTATQLFEDLLVDEDRERVGVRLKFFNLSRTPSSQLFDRALDALLSHPGWSDLQKSAASETDLFGARCPVRHNYELLQSSLVRARLRSLLELCDRNSLHVPIRQILILLTNALLGHPDAKDGLMTASDISKIITNGSVSKASLFNNLFGGNLSDHRRMAITIFDYLDRFQIGHETSNRVDNLLIFGEQDDVLQKYFDVLVAQDAFYGADARFYAAKREYIEGSQENGDSQSFLELLIAQRRALFFKILPEWEEELNLWELTVFKFAGEYLTDIVETLRKDGIVKRSILSRLVRGLNRVFTGMLINADRELFLASSGNNSQAKVSRILLERVSVEPNKGEKIYLRTDSSADRVILTVHFTPTIKEDFHLTLIRYEFLSRIALEGALPASFSKECYEDLLSFKSKLVAALLKRQEQDGAVSALESTVRLSFLSLTEQGMPDPKSVEVSL